MGAVEDRHEIVSTAIPTRPDVVQVDISMSGLNGIDAARQIARDHSSRTIFLIINTDSAFVREAVRAGAEGYVLKECAADELVDAIHQVLGGGTHLTPDVADNIALADLKNGKLPGELTSREREILELIAEGKSATEAAALLDISPKTVTDHKSTIMHKLGVRTTSELINLAVWRGIIGE